MQKLRWICLLLVLLMVSAVGAQSEEVIATGDEVEAELTDDMLEMRYTFTATAGERITITLSSRQFDTLLTLEDEDGTVIASNDDSAGSLNSQINNFELSTEGDYTIVVTSSSGEETGEFTLTFDSATATTIEFGSTIESTLDADIDEVIYQFEGTEGDVVSIRMESNDFDSYLRLSNQDSELMTDDDSAGNLNAMIASYVLPATDTYFVTASSFSSGASGNYTLLVSQVNSLPVDYNTPTEATIEGEPLYFVFNGQVGDAVSIRVRSEDGLLDTSLNLLNTFGFSIGNDDDGGYVYDPELNNITINVDGEYVAIVSPADEDTVGTFTIEVVQDPPTVLDCDTTETISLSEKLIYASYEISPEAGGTISFVIFGEESQLDSLSFMMRLNEEDIDPEYDWNTEGQVSVSIPVEESDEISLIVNSFAYTDQSFQMDVNCS